MKEQNTTRNGSRLDRRYLVYYRNVHNSMTIGKNTQKTRRPNMKRRKCTYIYQRKIKTTLSTKSIPKSRQPYRF